MILLDTNVLSEFMRSQPSERVVSWLDAQVVGNIWMCSISRAEIELGLALMPEGRRRESLTRAARGMFEEDFSGRCLPFDALSADWYARVVSVRTRSGRPISVEDAQIAAVALANQMSLATRNTADFAYIEGLTVIDPWATCA